MITAKNSIHGQWSSGWAFVLATTGAAVGLGNIWKFPYVTGVNGGGAFVLVYLACILLVGTPLVIAELMIGRRGRQNPVYAMHSIAVASNRNPYWKLAGGLCILTGFLILTYYSVISGWAFNYIVESALGHFKNATPEHVDKLFTALTSNPYRVLFWHTLIMVGATSMVVFGVQKGIERSVRFIFPGLVLILLILVIYAANTGYFREGVLFLFKPDFSALTANAVLMALGQAFFTLSIAYGTIMTYGAYVPHNVSIIKTSFIIAGADTLIAILAGLAIFPVVFAYGLEPGAGAGLIFQTLPISFGNMPYGSTFATLFFIMLVFTAFTTAVSLIEPSVAFLIEKYKLSRINVTIGVGIAGWLLGFISVFSFNIWAEYKILGYSIFTTIDYIATNIMLPLGGLAVAIFVAWAMKKEFVLSELKLKDGLLYRSLNFMLGFIAPIAIILIFLNAMKII